MKPTKTFKVFSDNPKMDTSGMAGKPRPLAAYVWEPPAMTIGDILEVQELKDSKRPETDDSNMRC